MMIEDSLFLNQWPNSVVSIIFAVSIDNDVVLKGCVIEINLQYTTAV